MKKHDILSLLSLLLTPVILIVLGLILLFNPDAAPVLIARVLGWVMTLAGIVCVISAVARRDNMVVKILGAVVFLCLGSFLSRNPTAPAKLAGFLLGAWLVTEGLRRFSRCGDRLWGLVTMALGALLIFLPMTASRLVFSLCGLAMVIVGVVMLLSRLRQKRLESGNDDPNIIDAL